MKNVGIITSNASFLDNYGAILQAYALSKQLEKWNCVPEIINYRYDTGSGIVEAKNEIDRSLTSKLSYLFNSNITMKQKFLYRLSRNKRSEQTNIFQSFIEERVNIDLKQSVDFKDLNEFSKKYQYLICGSDQVWNPIIHGNCNDDGFFLNFGDKSVKRIAYAPSFGISEIPKNCTTNLKSLLLNFDAISVREKSGSEIIKKYTGLEAQIVLDPTMMADKDIWDSFKKTISKISGKYILVYRFGKMDYFNSFIQKLARKLNVEIMEIPVSIESFGKGTNLMFDVGPEEFVTLIRNAEFVLTDSFHATVFSLLNHTPFYTFIRQAQKEKNNMNSRMENLLELVGLEDRMIYPSNTNVNFSHIDFSQVDKKIDIKRKESQLYLKEALGIDKNDNK